jgi:hypothetical protein
LLGGVDLDVEHVDVGEPLEQQRLALHHRLASERPNVAQAEDGAAVGHHGHQIPAGGVAERLQRVLLNVAHRHGHAWRIGQGQVMLGRARRGDRDRDLPGPSGAVVLAGFLVQHGFLVHLSMCATPSGASCPP